MSINAGSGKDSILINASNISALEQTGAGNRARVDGGGGIDTLVLEGSDLTLDLTKISDRRIQDIEVIDITGSGENTLKLNLDDLLHASSSTNILKVLGDSDDKVNAAGSCAGNEDFIVTGACECVGVFITEIINGVFRIATQFCQVYGNGVCFAEDDIKFIGTTHHTHTHNQIIQTIAVDIACAGD
jgi:hypothetical protein